ncbi:MAG TPA: serine hydrolase domain-containing protein [Acidimicrobiales bacterium]
MEALRAVVDWPVTAAAAVVVGAAGPDSWATRRRGDEGRTYPWASVTKLCTAWAVLVAVEEGSVSLDDALGPPGSTVAHLLSHASGLAPDDDQVLWPPARRRVYSNRGYELLAEHVAARTGFSFAQYVKEAVLDPLGMGGARWQPGGSAAAGLEGTPRDLAALAGELLWPRLVSAPTIERATSVVFPGIDGVLPGFGRQRPCDWGLGPELRGTKAPHWTGMTNSTRTFGHFGQSGAFVWVDPEAEVALASVSDRAFGEWSRRRWPALADAVLAELGRPAPA